MVTVVAGWLVAVQLALLAGTMQGLGALGALVALLARVGAGLSMVRVRVQACGTQYHVDRAAVRRRNRSNSGACSTTRVSTRVNTRVSSKVNTRVNTRVSTRVSTRVNTRVGSNQARTRTTNSSIDHHHHSSSGSSNSVIIINNSNNNNNNNSSNNSNNNNNNSSSNNSNNNNNIIIINNNNIIIIINNIIINNNIINNNIKISSCFASVERLHSLFVLGAMQFSTAALSVNGQTGRDTFKLALPSSDSKRNKETK